MSLRRELFSSAPKGIFALDPISEFAFWIGLLTGVLVLVWTPVYPQALTLGATNLVCLIGGRLAFPNQKAAVAHDPNPLASKGGRSRRLVTSPFRFLAAVIVAVGGASMIQSVAQNYLTFQLGISDPVFLFYGLLSAAISESYLLHWGFQTFLSMYGHPWIGVLFVPILAVFLHSARYGGSIVALIVVFLCFKLLAFSYEWTHRLSVPIVAHAIINLAPLVALLARLVMV